MLAATYLLCPLPLPEVVPGLSPKAMPVLTELTTTLMFLKSRGFAASIVEGSGGGPVARVCRYLHCGPYTQKPSLNMLHSWKGNTVTSVHLNRGQKREGPLLLQGNRSEARIGSKPSSPNSFQEILVTQLGYSPLCLLSYVYMDNLVLCRSHISAEICTQACALD